MDFGPQNPIVRACLQGMQREAAGEAAEAHALFRDAFDDARDDDERLLAAHHVARTVDDPAARRAWLERALALATTLDAPWVGPARPPLHARLAETLDALGDTDGAAAHRVAAERPAPPTDPGPFFHGTRAALAVGDRLAPGHGSNYRPGLVMRHVYFTAWPDGAGLAAALAQGEGRERVYVVEPTEAFAHDPNVTNQRFPGNPTRSYRTEGPLTVVGELATWARPAPEVVDAMRARAAQADAAILD